MFIGRFTQEDASGYSSERYDFFFHEDGTVSVVRLRWWDDASYLSYQGDVPFEEGKLYRLDEPSNEDVRSPRISEQSTSKEVADELPF